jgi:ornithine cyclodeaminase/alanine dehydrogenase-like protein (mu-crystallin family)
LTLVLSERDVESLIDMKEVVPAVEEAFKHQGMGEVSNYMRTRSKGMASVLNVMHANLSYLGRGGLKSYMWSTTGTKFAVILFDEKDSAPIAVMGADILGRYRTGAASGVATKHLYGKRSGKLAIFGSGKQALAQVLAVAAVMSVDEARVWSPSEEKRKSFAAKLSERGFDASSHDTPAEAIKGVDVASAITSASHPFITDEMVSSLSHLNIAGSNQPEHSEVTTSAIGKFDTIVVDDVAQGKLEYGDLILAERAGAFDWDSAVELGDVVAGKNNAKGRTLFKSGGVALEDVAVASMLYDKAMKSGRSYPSIELV